MMCLTEIAKKISRDVLMLVVTFELIWINLMLVNFRADSKDHKRTNCWEEPNKKENQMYLTLFYVKNVNISS